MWSFLKQWALRFFVIITALWVCLFIWTHKPIHLGVTACAIGLWLVFAFFALNSTSPSHSSTRVISLYSLAVLLVLILFFSMKPSNDRQWAESSDRIINFEFKDGLVEVNNIRNFIWRSHTDYDVQWETRYYDLEKLERLDMAVSYFMKGPVAHVFVTFGFSDGEQLAFSLEVRQEHHESFSSVGGFFRQFELALVVGDENDLIYTRTNIRKEDVYLYPIKMDKLEIQMLFLEFLNKANRLNHTPVWYNTLMSNCTTILFDLAEHATGRIPRDYRVILPGLLPHYLYDYNVLDNHFSFEEWQDKAYVNAKTQNIENIQTLSSHDFSRLIRAQKPNRSASGSILLGDYL